jgi:tRNA(Glu) U13 pseudouridine synthase TruD
MYLHAAQSELWNLAVTHRVTQHPADRVIAGDLVATDPQDVMKVH